MELNTILQLLHAFFCIHPWKSFIFHLLVLWIDIFYFCAYVVKVSHSYLFRLCYIFLSLVCLSFVVHLVVLYTLFICFHPIDSSCVDCLVLYKATNQRIKILYDPCFDDRWITEILFLFVVWNYHCGRNSLSSGSFVWRLPLRDCVHSNFMSHFCLLVLITPFWLDDAFLLVASFWLYDTAQHHRKITDPTRQYSNTIEISNSTCTNQLYNIMKIGL